MTNEKKAHEIASLITSVYGVNIEREIHIYTAAIEAMEWKDNEYKEREEGLRETINALEAKLQKANEVGMYYFDQCNFQKQALIDKTCEWLKANMYEGTCEQILSKKPYPFMSDFINEFKQAMKGE